MVFNCDYNLGGSGRVLSQGFHTSTTGQLFSLSTGLVGFIGGRVGFMVGRVGFRCCLTVSTRV